MARREKDRTQLPTIRWWRWFRLTRRRVVVPSIAAFVILTAALVTSCWMPNEFVSELRLSTDRSYGFVYEGELVWIPLVRDIRDPQKKMTSQEIGQSIAVLERDLRRDSNFKDIRSLGDGRFKVRYEAQGRLGERGIFIFLRRTDRLVVLETFEDGTARITSKAVKIDQRKEVAESGITVRGKFRVVTNGTATQGNADSLKVRGYQNYVIYDWTISSAETPSPVLYVDLKTPAILPH